MHCQHALAKRAAVVGGRQPLVVHPMSIGCDINVFSVGEGEEAP